MLHEKKRLDEIKLDFSGLNFDEDPEEKSRKSWFMSGIVIIAALIILIIMNWQNISGSVIKNFKSPSAYFLYVESREFRGYAEVFADLYEAYFLENVDKEEYFTADIEVSRADTVDGLLELALNQKMDTSWLDMLHGDLQVSCLKNGRSVGFVFQVDGKKIAAVNSVSDENDTYLSFPELNTDCLKTGIQNEAGNSVFTLKKEQFAESELFDRIIERYSQMVLSYLCNADHLNDVINNENIIKSTGMLESDGIRQTCTVLECRIDQQLFLDILEVVLAQAKAGEDVKKMFDDIQAVYDVTFGITNKTKNRNFYEIFIRKADRLLSYIDAKGQQGELENKDFLVLTDYVSNKHEIIGRKLVFTGDFNGNISYMVLLKGSEFAFEYQYLPESADTGAVGSDTESELAGSNVGTGVVSADTENGFASSDMENGTVSSAGLQVENLMEDLFYNSMEITGTGTEKEGMISGEFIIKANALNTANIQLESVDVEQIRAGYPNGSIAVMPHSDAIEKMADTHPARYKAMKYFSPGIELKADTSNEERNVSLTLLSAEQPFLGLDMKGRIWSDSQSMPDKESIESGEGETERDGKQTESGEEESEINVSQAESDEGETGIDVRQIESGEGKSEIDTNQIDLNGQQALLGERRAASNQINPTQNVITAENKDDLINWRASFAASVISEKLHQTDLPEYAASYLEQGICLAIQIVTDLYSGLLPE